MPLITMPISLGWWDIMRRQKVDRLLMFLSRFDDHNRVRAIKTNMDNNGHLTTIILETTAGERYTRPMDQQMLDRLDVFERVTLYFNTPGFREQHPEAVDLIDKSLVLIETLFKVDHHLFDEGVNGIHIHHSHLPTLNLDTREAVQYVRHVYDWDLDKALEHPRGWISPPESPLEVLGVPLTEQIPNYRYQEKKKNQDPEGYNAFIAEIDALLAEDDDTTPPPENSLPKAMPTG